MDTKVFKSKQSKDEYLEYIWYEPHVSEEPLPLVIYIHGAGARGNDITKMPTNMGPIGEIKSGRKLDAIVAMPQCHCDTWFEVFPVLLEFIDEMRSCPKVDMNRVYLCGSSMGAYTAWQVAMSRPEWIAALVPVCGGGMYWNASRLIEIPIWAFHGALDSAVLPEESIHMVSAVNRAGGKAKLTVFPDVAHGAWVRAFAQDDMWEWMFEQSLAKEKI